MRAVPAGEMPTGAWLLRDKDESGSKVLVTGSGLNVTVLVVRGRDSSPSRLDGIKGVFSLMT